MIFLKKLHEQLLVIAYYAKPRQKNSRYANVAAAAYRAIPYSLQRTVVVRMAYSHIAANANVNAVLKKGRCINSMEDRKTRKCLRCKQEKSIEAFARTPSRFFPAHHSLYCTQCLEATTPQDNLGEVDRVLRWLDLPFDLNKWT